MTYSFKLKKSKLGRPNRYFKVIILLALLFGIFFQAQTNRYIYELRLKMDSTDHDYQKYHMILDIGKNETKFYGRDLLISDSINKKFGNIESKHIDMTGQIVKRKTGSPTNENFLNIKFDYYTYSTTDPIHWEIDKETKKFNDYIVQRATADFGGRHWIAWFSTDVPLNEGPYKFTGLPGLVFEIYDDKNNFIYKLVKNEKLIKNVDMNDFLESNFGNKAVKINEAQRKKLLMDFYNDPFSFERTNLADRKDLDINIGGKQVKNIEELNAQVKAMQGIISKYNNPVDLQKAIKYCLVLK
ncbi:GLPGLI family protein [Chryseobacterium sp. PBS4-4]|uniref:GLPGLI family protein n=1 Tax=Chryseobacterium edaphi TaxID=2976532 RepID=A0ABT2W8S8_9FLAO|nr:GLPGLI family protein [Chryseobacterium edaphi]MCU7617075.1 GLPGLI family protein [Chryseobacterium edaphi]